MICQNSKYFFSISDCDRFILTISKKAVKLQYKDKNIQNIDVIYIVYCTSHTKHRKRLSFGSNCESDEGCKVLLYFSKCKL